VSFTEVDYHVLIPTREEYDKQTKDALWWTNVDIAQFAMAELRRRERNQGKDAPDDDEESATDEVRTADEGDECVDACNAEKASCSKARSWGKGSMASPPEYSRNETIVTS